MRACQQLGVLPAVLRHPNAPAARTHGPRSCCWGACALSGEDSSSASEGEGSAPGSGLAVGRGMRGTSGARSDTVQAAREAGSASLSSGSAGADDTASVAASESSRGTVTTQQWAAQRRGSVAQGSSAARLRASALMGAPLPLPASALRASVAGSVALHGAGQDAHLPAPAPALNMMPAALDQGAPALRNSSAWGLASGAMLALPAHAPRRSSRLHVLSLSGAGGGIGGSGGGEQVYDAACGGGLGLEDTWEEQDGARSQPGQGSGGGDGCSGPYDSGSGSGGGSGAAQWPRPPVPGASTSMRRLQTATTRGRGDDGGDQGKGGGRRPTASIAGGWHDGAHAAAVPRTHMRASRDNDGAGSCGWAGGSAGGGSEIGRAHV